MLYHFRDIASYLWKTADFNLPHLYLAPSLGVTHRNVAKVFSIRKLESLSYCVALFANSHHAIFSHFDRTMTCDKLTDRQTQTDRHIDTDRQTERHRATAHTMLA